MLTSHYEPQTICADSKTHRFLNRSVRFESSLEAQRALGGLLLLMIPNLESATIGVTQQFQTGAVCVQKGHGFQKNTPPRSFSSERQWIAQTSRASQSHPFPRTVTRVGYRRGSVNQSGCFR